MLSCIPLTILQENTRGARHLCASVALDSSADHLAKHLGHAVYDKSRSGALDLPGFPKFDPLVSALRSGVPTAPAREYQVCTPVTCFQHSWLVMLLFSAVWCQISTEVQGFCESMRGVPMNQTYCVEPVHASPVLRLVMETFPSSKSSPRSSWMMRTPEMKLQGPLTNTMRSSTRVVSSW